MAQDYAVTGQRHTTVINDSGQLTQVMEVTFKTTSGVVAHVDVPLTQYNQATVREMIEAYVANINAVHNL
jgi:hypothetical protein